MEAEYLLESAGSSSRLRILERISLVEGLALYIM